jgi:serine/threonine protein kinase
MTSLDMANTAAAAAASKEASLSQVTNKAETVMEISPGDDRFERYEKMIGQGSFKCVWEAFDTHEGCNVAWSVVNVRTLSKEMRTATINERKLLEAVGDKSPYLINLKKTWYNAEKSEVVFITELCSGGSLNEYLKNSGTVRLSVIKKVLRQVLSGLIVLHDHGAIHRDLKAENVYVQRATGDIRIGDYGLAAYSGPGATANLGKTMTGTPCFMAPEVLNSDSSHQYNEKVDIWSFGLVVVELITSIQPYSECHNMSQLLQRIQKGEPPNSLKDIKHALTQDLISACLQIDPEKRPSAKDLLTHDFFKTTKEDAKTTTESMIRTEEEKIDATQITDPKVARELCQKILQQAKEQAKNIIADAKEQAKNIMSNARMEAQRAKRPSLTVDFLSADSNSMDQQNTQGSTVNTEDLLGLSSGGVVDGLQGQGQGQGQNDSDQELMRSFSGAVSSQGETGDLLGELVQINKQLNNGRQQSQTPSPTMTTGSGGGGGGDQPKASKRRTKLIRLNSGIRDLAGSIDEYMEVAVMDESNREQAMEEVKTAEAGGRGEPGHHRVMTSSFDKLLHGAVTGLRVATTMSAVARTKEDVQKIFLDYANDDTQTLPKDQLRTLCTAFGIDMSDTDLRAFWISLGSSVKKIGDQAENSVDIDDQGEVQEEHEKEVTLEQFMEWWDRQGISYTKTTRRGSALPRTRLVQELKNKYHRVGSMGAPALLHVKKISMKDNTFIPPLPLSLPLPTVKEGTITGVDEARDRFVASPEATAKRPSIVPRGGPDREWHGYEKDMSD